MILQRTAAAAAAALVFGSSSALAQTAPSPIVPGGRPDHARPTAPVPQEAPAATQSQPQLPQITPFELRSVQVAGSTLPPQVLEQTWRPFAGRTLDTTGLAQVSDAIIAAYEKSNVALYTVVVPVQDFTDGVLRVEVFEGFVESVRVEGDSDPKALALVEQRLSGLVGQRPLTKSNLQRRLLLARDLPGVRTELQFVGGGTSQAVGVVATVEAQPVQVALSANNRGAAFLGRTQLAADLYLNNWIPGGQSRLSYVTPTEWRRFRYVGAGHSQLLGESGASLQVNAGHLRTKPEGSDVRGEATSAGVQFTYPAIRSFEQDLYVSAGLDGLNANSVLLGSAFSDDRSRAARVSVLYGYQDESRRVTLSGALSVGLDAFGAQTLAPGFTELEFVKFNGRATLATQLADRLVLRLAAAGQLSGDRLPAAEQFALGGNEFGRGYEAAVLMGDQGYAASAEIAAQPSGMPSMLRDAEAYAFVDGGSTIYNSRPLSQELQADLASTGLGVRATVLEHVALQLEATKGLGGRRVPSEAADNRLIFAVRTLW